jgi:16S rRNA U516 pseudouridylate synthase RsuA-like enzyme
LQACCCRAILSNFLSPTDVLAVLEAGALLGERRLLVPALAYLRTVLPLLLERSGGDTRAIEAVVPPADWAALQAELAARAEAVARMRYAGAGRVLHRREPLRPSEPPGPEPDLVKPEPERLELESATPELGMELRSAEPEPEPPVADCSSSSWWRVERRCLVRAGAALDSPVLEPPLELTAAGYGSATGSSSSGHGGGGLVEVDGAAAVDGRTRLRLAAALGRPGGGWVSEVDGRGRTLLRRVAGQPGGGGGRPQVGGASGAGAVGGGDGRRGGAGGGAGGGGEQVGGPAAGLVPAPPPPRMPPARKAAVRALRDPRLLELLLPYPAEWAAAAAASSLGLRPAQVAAATTHARNGFGAGDPASRALIYFLLHKPAGCICQRTPPHTAGQPPWSVYSRLPPGFPPVPAVGRLDQDTEGLLLFTEDSTLGHALIAGGDVLADGERWAAKHRGGGGSSATGPAKAEKVYHVLVTGVVAAAPAAQLGLLRDPIEIDGRLTAPAAARLLPPAEAPAAPPRPPAAQDDGTEADGGAADGADAAPARGQQQRQPPAGAQWVEVVIAEGRNRQVRRLCDRCAPPSPPARAICAERVS